MSRLGIVGAGSIGSTLARAFDQLGHQIYINDTDPDAVNRLPYPESSKEQLAHGMDYVIFAVPTPTGETGGDASAVDSALTAFQDTDVTLILRSTMPPGSTRRLAEKHGLPLVYSPEFLRDRSGVQDVYQADRLVIASPSETERESARQLLDGDGIQNQQVITTDRYLPAEIGKEAHNAFFATKVSFANQLRLICEQDGVDPTAVMDIVTADSRNTSSHLDPLLGPYGGKCLPKDTRALALYGDQQGAPTPLLDGVINLNREARRRYEDMEIEGEWPDIQVRGD